MVASWLWSWWLNKERAGSNICFQPYPTSRGTKWTEQTQQVSLRSLHSRDLHLLHLGGFPSFCSLKNRKRKQHLHLPQPSSNDHHNPSSFHFHSTPIFLRNTDSLPRIHFIFYLHQITKNREPPFTFPKHTLFT